MSAGNFRLYMTHSDTRITLIFTTVSCLSI